MIRLLRDAGTAFEPDPAQDRYLLVAALFRRLLGLIYLVAFVSIAVQITGLVGSEGILPVQDHLDRVAREQGHLRFVYTPTLFWFNASDSALLLVPVAGAIVSLFIIFLPRARLALILAFVLYLSVYHVAQAFMNFQWDTLLLEAGFLAMFLVPGSRLVIVLFRLLLFKLRFMSGLSKLLSGDPAWRELTALNHYFEVQPLPTPLAWYAHHLPEWLLKTGTAGTLFVELIVPFMMFLPRRWRFTAAWLTILWQVLIILTSNHNWFNFLTIILCLFLFDDQALRRVMPDKLAADLSKGYWRMSAPGRLQQTLVGGFAALIVFVSGVHLWELSTMQSIRGTLGEVVRVSEGWRIASKYHVFPNMRTSRVEIQLEGSHDGRHWKRYAFKYKPDGPDSGVQWVIPHQPRLDWMMWFVTLHPLHMQWFEPLVRSLLENRPAATALLAQNPFAERAPRFIRVRAVRYRFTEPGQDTGHWWRREPLGPFPPLPGMSRRAPY